jgi:uncharacterized membrane protein YphA (DoxX/SURF4 family)
MKAGRIIFAIGIIGLGVLCFMSKDFIVGRPPVTTLAATMPGKVLWAYVSGSLLILCGLAVIFGFKGRLASIIVAILIFLFSFLLRHMYEMKEWASAYKTLALGGGALIIAASFPGTQDRSREGFLTNYTFVYTGCLFFSLFFIICGFAHFRFDQFIINDFIPGYIPFHPFWTYFCGACLLAAGVGLIIPPTRKWAALLSGIMIAGWFILLHVPRFVSDPNNTSDRLGLCESFTFVGILFVLTSLLSKKEKIIV